MTDYSKILRIGYITDIHYNLPENVDGIGGPGGWRQYSTASQRTIQAVQYFAEQEVDIILNGGDQFQNWAASAVRGEGLNVLTGMRDSIISAIGSKNIPFYSVPGNHQVWNFENGTWGYGWEEYFETLDNGLHWERDNTFPDNSSIPFPFNYTADIGDDWRLVCIHHHSDHPASNAIGTRYLSSDDRPQYYSDLQDWTRGVLNTPRSVIVMAHALLWPSTGHTSDLEFWRYTDKTFTDIFEEFGNVQLALAGHWHPGTNDDVTQGVRCLQGRGSILSMDPATYTGARDLTQDNAYYLIEIIPDATTNPYDPSDTGSVSDVRIIDTENYWDDLFTNYGEIDIPSTGYPYYSKTRDFDVASEHEDREILTHKQRIKIEDKERKSFLLAGDGSSCEIEAGDRIYTVSDVSGKMVWMQGSEEEAVFDSITPGETKVIEDEHFRFTIEWEGAGSHLFSITVLNLEIASFYKSVSDLIDSSQRRGGDISGGVEQMLVDLNNSEILEGEVERDRLASQISETSNMLEGLHKESSVKLKYFVASLQRYIEESYGSSINDFLRDHGVKVKSVFAEISEEVDFSIDSDNIEVWIS